MAVRRVFSCECGHRLRFGASNCSRCWTVTPIWNRRHFWTVIGIGAVILVLMGISALT